MSPFAATYAEARDKFLSAAAARGAAIRHRVHPTAHGAEGEALAIDAALLGDADADALLLLTSGTHGVEGFCGSGCQLALLADDAFVQAAEQSGVALLFVHAVNPYGFSHVRRVNEDNVDLNRNFQDFTRALPENEGYARLHRNIVPDSWPPPPENEAVIGAFLAQHGLAALQALVSAGQYAFPDGLFYGGTRAVWSNVQVREILRSEAARARLGWIDLHSGLGARGVGEKIYAGRNEPESLARARAWWGADVTSFHEGSSVSAALSGAMYEAAYQECPRTEFTGIALEFGTVPIQEVFGALRAEQWLHNHPAAPAPVRDAIKAAMRRAFFVDEHDWQFAVVNQTRAAVVAALAQLRHE